MILIEVRAKTLILILLAVPVLLWILESILAGDEGEMCHSWTSGVKNPNGAFWCPRHPTDMAAKFCCGTCSAPYCCSNKEARLDQTLCPAGQQRKKITKTRRRRTTPTTTANVPLWALILAVVFLIPIGCGLISATIYVWRRFRRWWESRNMDQQLEQLSLPTINIPSMFDLYTAYDEDSLPSYNEVMDPHGPWAFSPTSDVPPVAQDHENAGYEDNEAQPSPSHPTEPASEMGGPHPSQACASSLEPSSSDAEESSGDRAWPPASQKTPPPSYKTICAFDRDVTLPYNTEGPYGSWAAAGTRARVPLAHSAAQGNPRFGLLDLEGVRLRHSTVASPTLASDDPPPYGAAGTLGRPILPCPRRSAIASPTLPSEDPLPDRTEVSHGHQIQPRALESTPAVQFQRTTLGAAEAKVNIVSPPALPDTAAAGPILEPVLEAEEPDCLPASEI